MNSPPFRNRPKLSPRHLTAIMLGAVAVVALSVLILSSNFTSRFSAPPEPDVVISTGTIKEGDVLAKVLAHHGVKNDYIYSIQKTLNTAFDLRRIRPGVNFEVATSTDGIFQAFTYRDTATHAYTVHRSSIGVYSLAESEKQTVWIEKRITGTINEFMYKDLLKQGYPNGMVAWLISDIGDNIFAWRIDFFTEQRPGDTYDILFEQEYEVGKDRPVSYGQGRVLAAKYNGKATKVKENVAIRYQSPGAARADYYDHEGNAVRKAFLRAPFLQAAFRVSSRFNPKRMHPILRTYRPHHGTDYAAARGTPVVSIGKGTVIRASWYKGYGNCVDIRHSGKYVSRYGHLSKIHVNVGQSISQGTLIGRVGSTGLSTGPHLHFEMLVDGRQKDFLRMDFPSASAVAKNELPEFFRVRDDMIARLNARSPESPTQVASQVTIQ